MGAIGHPGDIERLRMAAIELASTEGFARSAADVSLRRLAYYSLSPMMKNAFEQIYGAPFLRGFSSRRSVPRQRKISFCVWNTTAPSARRKAATPVSRFWPRQRNRPSKWNSFWKGNVAVAKSWPTRLSSLLTRGRSDKKSRRSQQRSRLAKRFVPSAPSVRATVRSRPSSSNAMRARPSAIAR